MGCSKLEEVEHTDYLEPLPLEVLGKKQFDWDDILISSSHNIKCQCLTTYEICLSNLNFYLLDHADLMFKGNTDGVHTTELQHG